MLCDALERRDAGGGRGGSREGIYAYKRQIHVAVPQKLTQRYKAIMLSSVKRENEAFTMSYKHFEEIAVC